VSEPTLFSRIIAGEIPSDRVHEDEHCIAIRDIDPQAPVHILVIPRKELVGVQAMESEDRALLGHLLFTARKIAEQEGLAEDGYRLVINAGSDGGQEVPHLHVHVLGGRQMLWPPG